MLLIPTDELRIFDHEEDIHREAQSLVTDAYRKAREDLSPTEAFDTALKAYRAKFPHIPKDIASQALACILAAPDL
jgi:phosphoribosylaminoimidazole-succinocarboxamide synthase